MNHGINFGTSNLPAQQSSRADKESGREKVGSKRGRRVAEPSGAHQKGIERDF